jgi:acyl carrier protein phosphodiesterase
LYYACNIVASINVSLINYLAHAYLSFGHPEILAGNMISDFVKGKKKFDYPAGVQQGIVLHRAIDAFTDGHEATREAKAIFRPDYRLYSGAFVDVVYDHFLANDPAEFTDASLLAFSRSVYDMLEKQSPWFPDKFAMMFPYMQEHNWLYHYRERWGIERSLNGVVRRSTYLTESKIAFRLFEQHYQVLEDCFRHFWAFAKPFARQEFELLQQDGERSSQTGA